jgi:branched-subunit amino acid transport protein AzlD
MENNMIIALIIVAYIASVFLNRWLNYLLVKWDDANKQVWVWFCIYLLPFAFIITLFIRLFKKIDTKVNINNKFTNWFTGKHW